MIIFIFNSCKTESIILECVQYATVSLKDMYQNGKTSFGKKKKKFGLDYELYPKHIRCLRFLEGVPAENEDQVAIETSTSLPKIQKLLESNCYLEIPQTLKPIFASLNAIALNTNSTEKQEELKTKFKNVLGSLK